MTTCSQFACCVSLIDAGSHPLGNSQWGKQIFIGFELLLPLQLTSVSKEIVFGAYELSWSSGAIFKVTMERLMGHDWHEDSVRRFDPKAVLGRNCVLRFTCNQRGRNSISDFDVHPLPDGVNHTDLPKAQTTLSLFTASAPDMNLFQDLPVRIQELISASPEFVAALQNSEDEDF